MVSPFGGDAQDFFQRMLAGQSAVRLYEHPFSPSRLTQPAVTCSQFNAESTLGHTLTHLTDRYSQLGLAAACAAWDDAALARLQDCGQNYGVSWGTGTGGMLTYEKGYGDIYLRGKHRVSPLSVPMAMNNAAAAHIAMSLGLGGPCLTYSVACASSTIAIGEAFRRIRCGETPIMMTGGSESPLAFTIMRAWEAMRVVASGDENNAYRACRPFQQGRTGLVLGEGAAALVLEDWEHAQKRGARIYCELAGFGQSCDHSNLVRPNQQGQSRAIASALREAELIPQQVAYVNAHGTATPEGDPTEINALKQVFGVHASQLAVSATKSMHGHSLGATGAIEALITVLTLQHQAIPPTAHLEQVAEDCLGVHHVMGNAMRERPLHAALSNSFAFGGSNAVLAFKTFEEL